MKVLQFLQPEVGHLKPYEPGKPIEYVAREFGLDPKAVAKLASNENALGPSPRALEAIRRCADQVHLYPDGGGYDLKHRLAGKYELKPEEIILGNGSNELLELVGHAFLGKGRSAVMSEYAFIVYRLVCKLFGSEALEAPATAAFGHDLEALKRTIREDTRVVFVCNPNNPTGSWVDADALHAFVSSLPEDLLVVIDEAYAEIAHVPLPDWRPLIRSGRPVLVTRTFSKAYGLAGLRIGYGLGPAPLITALNRARQPFNCNLVAQTAALAALDDEEFIRQYAALCDLNRREWSRFCEATGLPYFPSAGNFMLLKVGDGMKCFDFLQRRGCIVRPMRAYGLPEYIRVSFGREDEIQRCQELLKLYFTENMG